MSKKQSLTKKHKQLDEALKKQKQRARNNKSEIYELREKYKHICEVVGVHGEQIRELRLKEFERNQEKQRRQQEGFSFRRALDWLFCK